MFKKPISSAIIIVKEDRHMIVGRVNPFIKGYLEACFDGAVKPEDRIKPGIYTLVLERRGIKFNIALMPWLKF